MTRLELLHLLVARARANGFEFRRWYTARIGLPWISQEAALIVLESQRRYFALIFSHEFAQTFWKPGSDISFDVPPQVFQRAMPDGTVRTVRRKTFIRRSTRPNAWRYHLREMALAEEPLRYLRKYLHIEEDIPAEGEDPVSGLPNPGTEGLPAPGPPQTGPKITPNKRVPRPPAAGLPDFLQRPYRPGSK